MSQVVWHGQGQDEAEHLDWALPNIYRILGIFLHCTVLQVLGRFINPGCSIRSELVLCCFWLLGVERRWCWFCGLCLFCFLCCIDWSSLALQEASCRCQVKDNWCWIRASCSSWTQCSWHVFACPLLAGFFFFLLSFISLCGELQTLL